MEGKQYSWIKIIIRITSNSKNITQNKHIEDIQDISKIHIYNEQSNTRITSIAIAKYVTTQN